MKIAKNNIREYLTQPVASFIGMASFESRCYSIMAEMKSCCSKFVIFSNSQCDSHSEENLKKMIAIAEDPNSVIKLNLDDPMDAAGKIERGLDSALLAPGDVIFIDITTFTHEQLLILFRILSQKKPNRNVVFGYTGADRYSVNTSQEDVWLSRGVSQVRSVLGFPGNFLPSKRLHLVVLVGFEHERAKLVIETFEPNILTLGTGKKSHSVSEEHFHTNSRFFDDVRKFFDRRIGINADVNLFEFSCIDPLATKTAIIEEICKWPDHNTVICPMNTKLSTLGVALAAAEKPATQICYSRAIEYNIEGYSTPSSHVTLFSMRF